MKSSWYCLLGKDSGKILPIRGLKDRRKERWFSCPSSICVMSLPHGVRQRQDPQSKEVEGQQQVDVFLRKHLQANVCDCFSLLGPAPVCLKGSAGGTLKKR